MCESLFRVCGDQPVDDSAPVGVRRLSALHMVGLARSPPVPRFTVKEAILEWKFGSEGEARQHREMKQVRERVPSSPRYSAALC